MYMSSITHFVNYWNKIALPVPRQHFNSCFSPRIVILLVWVSWNDLTSAQTTGTTITNASGICVWNDLLRCNNVEGNYMPKAKSRCDYRMYVDFFKEVADNSGSQTPYSKVVGKDYFDHPYASKSKPKIMNPKYLCIRTDADKNIDINEFDCLPDPLDIDKVSGFCGCGSRWSRIDFNDRERSYIGLNNISHSYEYYAFEGLDKFLTVQKKIGEQDDYECVAHRFGHCTLDYYKKNKGWDITKCKTGFKCRNISVWSPIKKSALFNKNTGEWYGVCIGESTPDDLMDPYANSSPCRGHYNSLIFIITGLTTAFFVSICH